MWNWFAMRRKVWLFMKDEFREGRINGYSASEVLFDVRLVCVKMVVTQL